MTDANSGAEDDAISTREKYRRIAEHRRYPKKNYSFDDLTLGLTAMDAGVNRYHAMNAGKPAKRVLNYLAQAAKAAKPEVKAKAIKLARQWMGDVSRDRHPELAEQIESRILWEEGWRPETWDSERNAPRQAGPSVNPQTGMQEFFFDGVRDWFANTFGAKQAGAAEKQKICRALQRQRYRRKTPYPRWRKSWSPALACQRKRPSKGISRQGLIQNSMT